MSARRDESEVGGAPGLGTCLGLVLIFTPLCARMVSGFSMLPGWDLDPMIENGPFSGMGPAASMVVDTLVVLGAAILLWSSRRLAISRWTVITALMVFAGVGTALFHGWVSAYANFGQQRIGAAWAAAMIAAFALHRACADDRLRRVAWATVLGFIIVLIVKGVSQVAYENPETMAEFQSRKSEFFAAQGWSGDSSMARSYERRIMQNVATGWLGLSNVFATFAAVGVAGFAALLVQAWRSRRGVLTSGREGAGATVRSLSSGAVLVPLLGTLACLVGVAMTRSKGGAISAVLALVLVAAFCRPAFASRTRLLGVLGPALVFAAIALIAVRGVIGERIGELSLFFRWFYLEAATKIALGHPLLGVGPDGFKDAYLLAKNPLSPEEVASPHCILFDWWACLGVDGLCWGAVFLVWLLRAALAPTQAPSPKTNEPARPLIRLVCTIAVLATFAALLLERAAMVPEVAIVRIVGLFVWCLISGWVVTQTARVDALAWRWGLAAGAIVAGVHAQIDVTGSCFASCGLWLAIIAVAAARGQAEPMVAAAEPPLGERVRRALPSMAAAASALGVCGLLAFSSVRLIQWESRLLAGADVLRPIAEINAELSRSRNASETPYHAKQLEVLAARCASLIGHPVSPTPEGLAGVLHAVETARIPLAIAELKEALAIPPGEFATIREFSKLRLQQALESGNSSEVSAVIDQTVELIATRWSYRGWGRFTSAEIGWLATCIELASTRGASSVRDALTSADRAQKLDPFNVDRSWAVLLLLRKQDDAERLDRAMQYQALHVLELDNNMRLDPTRRLSPEQRALAERLAAPPK